MSVLPSGQFNVNVNKFAISPLGARISLDRLPNEHPSVAHASTPHASDH